MKTEEELVVAFAQNLRAERARVGLSQQELSDKAGVDRMSISKYERGHALPNLNNAAALACALGCSLESLVS
ncbi:hypothetical protein AAY81_04840 [Denitrobacterium detoxificans]|uniref:DNA-binding transcriptional regulator, XRE-family HTH domain n=1 Tax=Denitrobacterium detoxificans TaxID=79604 RepID=A0A172RXW1_9ACTN|nr:helix-turn-helix transcriptional regulator [Denitrobacterium detoxificans]ANE22561.1 hypothetical protein AAY81_04840 [Denitrobacterium detoxificans]SEO99899.1 DNA-binding transcriptional regulator, XRE-family HTH domain [Denitrobacterium detoxificans]